MNEHDDYYEVLFLIPKTGNRFIIQNVQVEIENKHDHNIFQLPGGHKRKRTTTTWLEITLTVSTPEDHSTVDELRFQSEQQEMFLYFKNVHPNLIKGFITDVYLDHQKTTIQFTGNSTNKTYHDYITEVTNQLNAKQIVWDNKKPDPGFKKKVHFKETKKTKVLKRKLTF